MLEQLGRRPVMLTFVLAVGIERPPQTSLIASSSAQAHWSGCLRPPTLFGNGRTHTGEVLGPGGSRLANYGVSAELLKERVCTMLEPADHQEGGRLWSPEHQTVAEGGCSWK